MNFDDPKLTAYALGELNETERAEMEAQLDDDSRAFIAETQAFAARLEAELKGAPLPDLTAEQKEAIAAQTQRKVVAFPSRVTRWVITSGAVAACVVIGAFYALTPALVQKKEVARNDAQFQAERSEVSEPQIAFAPAIPAQAPASPSVQLNDEFKLPADTPLIASSASGSGKAPTIVRPSVAPTKESDHLSRTAKATGSFDGVAADSASMSAPPAAAPPVSAPQEIAASASAGSGRESRRQNRQLMSPQRPASTLEGHAEGSAVGRDAVATPVPALSSGDFNTESYDHIGDNPFLRVEENPLSTFSTDVDTASYSNVRRFLNSNALPPKDAVRIEELVNYFPYEYPQPESDDPFSVNVDVVPAPWNTTNKLVRIGLKGREVAEKDRPAANLVFLVDVSGSMDQPAKLPLVKESMRLLVGRLRPDDRVAIVVYAGASGMVLPSTEAAKKSAILSAIDTLQPGGSTNGEAGIQLAYDIAKANFIKDGNNRVILATDGDFNVGVTNEGELVRLVEEKAKRGVFLTIAGFGMGNYKDSMLETLSNKGNGNYAYIDNRREAEKTFVEQAGGTLVTVAKDVKIQVEFNPTQVDAFRLIGYENRILRHEEFNDDRKDAGDIGSGHTVTALYELVPAGSDAALAGVDPLRYQQKEKPAERKSEPASSEWLTVKLRYKQPDGDTSKLIEVPVTPRDDAKPGPDMQFASAVAAFGMILRDSPHKGNATWKMVLDLAENGLGNDLPGYRNEFISVARKAESLSSSEEVTR